MATDNLRQTLIELEQGLADQDEALAAAQAARDGTATLIGHYRAVIEHQTRHVPDEGTRLVSSDELRDSIESVLAMNGKPLHYREIYERLLAKGIRVRGEDPLKNTGAHLSSDERFRSDGNGRWGLSTWVPPAPEPPLNTVPVTRPDGSISYLPISPPPPPPPPPRSRPTTLN